MSSVEQRRGRGWARPAAFAAVCVLSAVMTAACDSDSDKPTAPTPKPETPATVSRVEVTGGTTAFTQKGATSQFMASVTLSDNKTEDRTSTAAWVSDTPSVATVSAQGLVTAQAEGQAVISATVSNMTGTRSVSVRLPKRTPDPAAGQRLPLPDVRAMIPQFEAERPGLLLQQSCPTGLKYVNNPFLDYIVDRLRTLDTRWGYNGKPNRSASDNNGVPVVAAGDEISYHYGVGPDEGSTQVYLIDLVEGHCGTAPKLTWRDFSGQEPGRWTGAGRF